MFGASDRDTVTEGLGVPDELAIGEIVIDALGEREAMNAIETLGWRDLLGVELGRGDSLGKALGRGDTLDEGGALGSTDALGITEETTDDVAEGVVEAKVVGSGISGVTV